MPDYKLLTPGPLTTTDTVKREMLFDHCTWDDDYKQITQRIRRGLVRLAEADESEYTAVLMQGSGTFGVEAVLTSSVGPDDKLLICSNGAYGARMAEIAKHAGLNFVHYVERYDRSPEPARVAAYLRGDPAITHVSMVHSETTSGILNDIEGVAHIVKKAGRTMIVDAMSSFGGVPMNLPEIGADFLISSANKCIQGVPGFSFILARRDALAKCKGQARSLSLDLYDQWAGQEKDGKWRFTSPTHVVLAFAKAMEELEAEGGIPARHKRYAENNRLLVGGMRALGFPTYINDEWQGPIITTFFYPEGKHIDFPDFYAYIKARGYAIYPGKVTDAETFRIGTIGEIYPADIEKVLSIIADYMKERV